MAPLGPTRTAPSAPREATTRSNPRRRSVSAAATQSVPWGIDRVGGVAAAARVDPNATGRVNVAVLDTGVDLDHPDVGDSVVWGADLTVEGEPRIGRQYADDVNGHGTHVAGTLAAADDGAGVVGVAPNVSVYAMRVLREDRRGYYSWWVEAIDLALAGPDGERGTADDADVITMSLGGRDDAEGLQRTVRNASRDAFVVAAAGNNGRTTGDVLYPAAYPSTVAVAATDRADDPTRFSSAGPAVDIAAPGADIRSTYPTEFGGPYATLRGTSMATPHVSATLALLLAQTDGHAPAHESLLDTVLDTAVDVGPQGRDDATGAGRLDALAAVERPKPSFRVETPVPAVGRPITLNASESVAVDGVARYNYSIAGTTLASTPNATASVEVPVTGTFDVSLTVVDGEGRSASTTRSVTVSEQSVPQVANVTPQSLNDDPLLEDIDGDGRGTIFDALAYWNNRNDPAIVDNPQYFDFDGDGDTGDLFDTLALYRTIRDA